MCLGIPNVDDSEDPKLSGMEGKCTGREAISGFTTKSEREEERS